MHKIYCKKADSSLQDLFENKEVRSKGLSQIQNTLIQKRDREEQSSVQEIVYLEYDSIKHYINHEHRQIQRKTQFSHRFHKNSSFKRETTLISKKDSDFSIKSISQILTEMVLYVAGLLFDCTYKLFICRATSTLGA